MEIGKLIEQYRVLEKIGTGGLGEVFLAEDTILHRRVALKFLIPEKVALSRYSILDEARSAASIDHPYACKIFEVGEYEGQPYIVMEYLEGRTLAQRLQSGPLPLTEALKIATEISEALAEAHDQQIVHCDLKPANVMITRSGHVKLMDFGLARRLKGSSLEDDESTDGSSGPENNIAGTTCYMAPEQARGEDLDPRTDVFAFGIVLFEMITGVHPFRKLSAQTTLAAILYESPPYAEHLKPGIPSALKEILRHALAKAPDARYRSARDLWSDLIHVQNGESLEAPVVTTAPAVPAIAILPFTDFSPERNQEYFCDGLAEELISELGRLESLRVASRTAAFRYRNSDFDLKEIGRALKVTSILEGSVRKDGDKVRIVVKLIDVESGYPIWSERYDRLLNDIFEIQDEISRAIVEKLRLTLTKSDSGKLIRRGSQNFRAYEHYLKGRYFWNKRTEENLKFSIDQFELALAADPNYALAHAGKADAYVALGLYGVRSPLEVMPLAKEAASQALLLNKDMPEALIASACVHAIYEWDWATAAREFETAIRLAPRYAQARQWYAINCLAPTGRIDRAIAQLEAATELEPLSLAIGCSLGVLRFFEGNFVEAIDRLREVLDLDEGFAIAHYFLGQVYIETHQFEIAIQELERAVLLTQRSSETVAMLGYAYAVSGDRPKAMQALGELTQRQTRQYVSPVLFAQLQIGLAEMESAIASLEEGLRLRSTDMIWLELRPAFATVRTYARVQRLLSKLGLPGNPQLGTTGG